MANSLLRRAEEHKIEHQARVESLAELLAGRTVIAVQPGSIDQAVVLEFIDGGALELGVLELPKEPALAWIAR